jgi:YbgC/YbaW family acyl-CoA thioester hydrolase
MPVPLSWLDDATRAAFGVPAGWGFGLRHRVRWSEVDPFGHANHAAYLEWFEEARNRYLEAVGLPPLSPTTPGPVLARVEVDYRQPLAYGREVLVTARAVALRRTSLTMEYAVWSDGLAARCVARIVLMVSATGERTPIPPAVRQRLLAADGPREE